MKTVPKAKGKAGVSSICACFDLKRDAYYKYQKRNSLRQEEARQVLELVKRERAVQPRVGTRKLYKALQPVFLKSDLKVGRDALFNILRQEELLVRRKKASCKTTDSYHRFHTYKNLIKKMEIKTPNQVWVSYITYIRTVKGFCYLALITDLYSRKIVGYDI